MYLLQQDFHRNELIHPQRARQRCKYCDRHFKNLMINALSSRALMSIALLTVSERLNLGCTLYGNLKSIC